MIVFLWFFVGLAGNGLLLYHAKNLEQKICSVPIIWCPTPWELLLAIVFAFLGPISLGVGAWFCIHDYFVDHPKNWWLTPICKPKDDK